MRRAVALLVVLLLVLGGWLVVDARIRGYLFGRLAAANGEWSAAFSHYADAWDADRGFLDVEARTAEAGARLQAAVPLDDLALEVRLLRWLAAASLPDALTSALNRSRVEIVPPDAGPAFVIGRYEVVNAQYRQFVAATGHLPPAHWPGRAPASAWTQLPVVGVSWQDAFAYCAWAGGRLPSEEEWQTACAGPEALAYPWGDDWLRPATTGRLHPSVGVLSLDASWSALLADGSDVLLPIGSACEAASAYGVQDLVGGVTEWTAGPADPNRPLRGSSWLDRWGRADWLADQSRCAARDSSHGAFHADVGFRCAFGGG